MTILDNICRTLPWSLFSLIVPQNSTIISTYVKGKVRTDNPEPKDTINRVIGEIDSLCKERGEGFWEKFNAA